MLCSTAVVHELPDRPPGFVPPDLSPDGLRLIPAELENGVYALMADRVPKNNNGLVVGEDAALVIDSGITPEIGHYIQEVVSRLTDKPVRYLVNTTYHGDHSFGNSSFGSGVTVLSSRYNHAAMNDLTAEKRARQESMRGDTTDLDSVTGWRRPEVVFDRYCEIDLGGRTVQLWHLGPGNGSGDTVVHVPDAGVAWTGNLTPPAGMPPMMLIGDPPSYMRTLRELRTTLDIDTFVPGHGPQGPIDPVVNSMLVYMENMTAEVTRRRSAGETLEEMYGSIPMRGIEPVPSAPESYSKLLTSFHELNILLTHRWLEGATELTV
ncbi:glyoxylase-like metal-dependent hydrolase (beta-lactamase superfamily II) [Haloactinospora alba]|uniref:Glyoxylase-like metal-dependent hydrolase (Beta-lactamase superfamily II) n=1 Tax=Haloactinospora alba TaxID=405555 RepID=A0A543NII2_9ACTN|nr:MBL fold metallo-hydrolase [Haloactinospora alba]TQN31647.1 glyoxylase-like metal-dependent hydrolase (beta-lactamase superfamily II) [Haloactinospora alba]